MQTFELPKVWDARKFAARYGLDYLKDFYVNAEGLLVVFPNIPDDPPIFEASDPPVEKPTVDEELAAIKARLDTLESRSISRV
jgi:hypothetical protein